MKQKILFSRDIIKLQNAEQTALDIETRLKNDIFNVLKRRGATIGISGGIDSSVTFALTVNAIGADRVIGIIMPEHDSSPDSKNLALKLADKFGVKTIEEDMTPALAGFGCYSRRDQAVKSVFSEYNPKKDKFKIEIKQNIRNQKLPSMFNATVLFSNGEVKSKLLSIKAYLQIVAASNFKQRSRMAMLYYHAEANHFAVVGTPNKHEVKQGFFVKNGDSGADVMPIANLYKTQVYQLARNLEIPNEIIDRTPTSDTYPAEQTQEEFFFQLPFHQLDLLWYAFENNYAPSEVGEVMEMSENEINAVFDTFHRKINTTNYLRMQPIVY